MNKKNELETQLITLTKGFYQLQKLRIQTGLRVVTYFKRKLGIEPGQQEYGEEALDAQAKQILLRLKKSHRRMTDGIASVTLKNFTSDDLISSFAEFALTSQYVELEKSEVFQNKAQDKIVQQHPLWDAFFRDIPGCGPTMASALISLIDIHKAKYPSSLYLYAGVDVGPDGKGRSRKKEHLVDVEYVAKDGTKQTKKSITYHPFLKAVLLGRLFPCFLKASKPNKYREAYREYKHRLEHHAEYKNVSKGHRHAMARRYAMKLFLNDLYRAWRELEGLPAHETYAEAKLGIKHGMAA